MNMYANVCVDVYARERESWCLNARIHIHLFISHYFTHTHTHPTHTHIPHTHTSTTGAELTYNYNFEHDFVGLEDDGTRGACHCGGEDCSGVFGKSKKKSKV
jgi:hypothetical protein